MLYSQSNAYTLGMVRIWVFGLAIFSRWRTPLGDMCHLPNYQPLGVMRLLGTHYWVPLITPEVAFCIQMVTFGLLILAALGARPYHLIASLACLAMILTEGLIRGSEVTSHSNIVIILLTAILAVFPAADALTFFPARSKKPRAQYQAALVTLSLVFCATYLMVAARRLSFSGIGIYLDDSILGATALRDAELGPSGGLGKWACESFFAGWALRMGFPLVTLFEFLTPLCIFSTRFRWLWLTVMVPFHFGAGLLMGIWFPYNLILIPVLIAGFDPFRHLTHRIDSAKSDKAQPEAIKLAA